MASAGPDPDPPIYGGFHAQLVGWSEEFLNIINGWKQTAQNHPALFAVLAIMFSPFLLMFATVMAPVLFFLFCALMATMICLVAVCISFACGFPVYFLLAGYGFFFGLYLIKRIYEIAHRIHKLYINIKSYIAHICLITHQVYTLYINIMTFPWRFCHALRREIRAVFDQLTREFRDGRRAKY